MNETRTETSTRRCRVSLTRHRLHRGAAGRPHRGAEHTTGPGHAVTAGPTAVACCSVARRGRSGGSPSTEPASGGYTSGGYNSRSRGPRSDMFGEPPSPLLTRQEPQEWPPAWSSRGPTGAARRVSTLGRRRSTATGDARPGRRCSPVTWRVDKLFTSAPAGCPLTILAGRSPTGRGLSGVGDIAAIRWDSDRKGFRGRTGGRSEE
jgi:hypothetical protein